MNFAERMDVADFRCKSPSVKNSITESVADQADLFSSRGSSCGASEAASKLMGCARRRSGAPLIFDGRRSLGSVGSGSSVPTPPSIIHAQGDAWEGESIGMGGVVGVAPEGDISEENSAMQSTISVLQRALQESQKTLDYTTRAHDVQLSALSEEVAVLRARVSRTSGVGVNQEVEKQDVDVQEELRSRTKQIIEMRNQIEKLKAQVSKKNDQISNLKDTVDDRDTNIRSLEYRIDIFEKEMKKKTEENLTLANLMTRLQHDLVKSADAISDLTEENKSLAARAALLDSNFKEIMESLNVELEEDGKLSGSGNSSQDEFHDACPVTGDMSFRSLRHELESSLYLSSIDGDVVVNHDHKGGILEGVSYLTQISESSKSATLRQNSTQTDALPSRSSFSQYDRYDADVLNGFQHTVGTDALPQLRVDTVGVQAIVGVRAVGIQSSPTSLIHVSVGTSSELSSKSSETQTSKVSMVNVGCNSETFTLQWGHWVDTLDIEPNVNRSVSVQVDSISYAQSSSSSQTERYLSADIDTQTHLQLMASTISQTEKWSVVSQVTQTKTVVSQSVDCQANLSSSCVDAGTQSAAKLVSSLSTQTIMPKFVSSAFGISMADTSCMTDLTAVDILSTDTNLKSARAEVEAAKREAESIDAIATAFATELSILEEKCSRLESELTQSQKDILENRRQFNIRKHFDKELERWIDSLKIEVSAFDDVLNDAREAIEKKQGLDEGLLMKIELLENLATRSQKRNLGSLVYGDLDISLESFDSKPILSSSSFRCNELSNVVDDFEVEEWSDDDEVESLNPKNQAMSAVTVKNIALSILLVSILCGAVGITHSSQSILATAFNSNQSPVSLALDNCNSGCLPRKSGSVRRLTDLWLNNVDKTLAVVEAFLLSGDGDGGMNKLHQDIKEGRPSSRWREIPL